MNRSTSDNSNLKTEAIAGITTFFTRAYIVIVNPQILSAGGKTGMAFNGVLTATVIICFTMTLLMGLYAKLPFAVAPGMGINAFFTYTIILGKGVPWPTALGIIFWAGVFFLFDIDSPHFLDHAGNSLGIYLARRSVSDGGPTPRYPSGDVCAGVRIDRVAGA